MNKLLFLISIILFSCQSQPPKQDNQAPLQPSVKTEAIKSKKAIVFFGDSITAGYRLDLSEAFPALIGEFIDSLGLDYQVINAGLSGETTASGASRIDWVLKNKVDVFILELGANDGLRGIKTEETINNLQTIIDKVKAKYPEAIIILAGMQIPPNLGIEYSNNFRELFPTLAVKNKLTLIPFLLEFVAGNSVFNLDDGIHPNVDGHKTVANNVWKVLKEVL